MKHFFYFICFFVQMTAYQSFAQQKTIPLSIRNVSGVLRDSLNKPIEGATVSLISSQDTLKTSTNKFGYYGFKDVKSADFLLSIRVIGYDSFNRKYFNNDTKPQINMHPIQLGVKEERLETVTIVRLKGALIKGDTTEFWAKDYIVRDYARLEDLLRRMEGINIGPDGGVTYNGEPVLKALFNNENYFNGSVQEAMKELPADIVERIQIIERDESGLGQKKLRAEQSTKVMNIVTKADKSAGRMYDFSMEAGTQNRYNGRVSQKSIDATDQRSYKAGYSQKPLGIKTDPVPGAFSRLSFDGIIMVGGGDKPNETYGTTKKAFAGISKNFSSAKFSFTPIYDFQYTDSKSGTERYSETYYQEGTLAIRNLQTRNQRVLDHGLATSFYLTQGILNLSGNLNLNFSNVEQEVEDQNLRSGLVKGLEIITNTEKGNEFKYNLNLMNQSKFGKKWSLRNVFNSTWNSEKTKGTHFTDSYGDPNNLVKADSMVHQKRSQNNNSWTVGLNNFLIWEKNNLLKWQFNWAIQYRSTLRDIQSYLLGADEIAAFDELLSNNQSENSLTIPLAVSPEFSFKSGLYVTPSVGISNQWLNGKIEGKSQYISRWGTLLDPKFTIGFRNRKLGGFSLGVTQNRSMPSINALNKVPFYRTPYDIVIGNPDLENSLRNTLNLKYDIFMRKIGFQISFLSIYSKNEKIITSNRTVKLMPNKNIMISEMSYLNMEGGDQSNVNLTMTKLFVKINSTLKFNSSIMYSNNPYMSNGKAENRQSTIQTYNLSMFYSPMKWLDITTELRYQGMHDKNSLAMTNNGETYNNNFYANLKLGFYLPKDWSINLDFSQSAYYSTNLMSNHSPFVLNANIEKRIFKNRNGLVSIVVMDAARQNAVTNYSSTNMGFINTVTNMDSRYYLLQLSYRPEIFGKSKYDKGKGRAGDGSFIK